MPQIRLEYTAHPSISPQEMERCVNSFFPRLHRLLVDTVSGIDIHACKSGMIPLSLYCLGEGGTEDTFLHLTIGLLSGRSLEEKKELSLAALKLLEEHAQWAKTSGTLQVTVAIEDMTRETYSKIAIK